MKRILAATLAALFATAFASSARAQDDDRFDDRFEAPPPPPPDDDFDAPPPAAAEPPPKAPTQAAFDEQLSPYGRWVDTPEYGRVWIPSGVSSDWQPYAEGRWVDTAYGWSFVAGVPWGWAVYHYGRWGWRAGFGWFWVPGFAWAPAWVSWRHVYGYACWSPLGPRGYVYGRRWPGWVVVPHAHFTRPIPRYLVPRAQVGAIVRSARPVRAFPSYRAHAVIGRHGGGHHGRGHRR
jgi:hypothetical protein